mgnify:CR=1 FL=1
MIKENSYVFFLLERHSLPNFLKREQSNIDFSYSDARRPDRAMQTNDRSNGVLPVQPDRPVLLPAATATPTGQGPLHCDCTRPHSPLSRNRPLRTLQDEDHQCKSATYWETLELNKYLFHDSVRV